MDESERRAAARKGIDRTIPDSGVLPGDVVDVLVVGAIIRTDLLMRLRRMPDHPEPVVEAAAFDTGEEAFFERYDILRGPVPRIWIIDEVLKANRRTVLGAGMMGVRGRIQREGKVLHLVSHHLSDLSQEFASVGWRGSAGSNMSNDAIHSATSSPHMPPAKDMADPYGHVVDDIGVKTRDFS